MINYIRDKLKNPEILRIVQYLFFGGLTTLVNFGLYTFFTRFADWDVNFSNVTAVFASVVFAYVTNKIFVFRSRTDGVSEFLRECASFFGGRGLTIALDIGGLYLFHSVMGLNDLAVKIVINVIVIVLNYLISKFIVFKKTTGG